MDQPRHLRGTRIGIPARVGGAWREYREADGRGVDVERHAREVHYDVLRREGFDADRARQISARSSEEQQRLTERMREEGQQLVSVPVRRPALPPSGFRVESLLPASFLSDEERAAREAEVAERDAALRSEG